MNLSVVLPCYNEEGNIEAAVRDVDAWRAASGHDATIIVVDDGSKDRSPEILKRLEASVPKLRVVTLPQNGGYGIAVRAGCDAAETEWIAFMDSDGQFKAKDFDTLIAKSDGVRFVTGRRIKRADPFIRNVFGKVLGVMNFVFLGIWVRDVNCGMKMFRKDTWPEIRPVHGVEKLFNAEMFLRLKRRGIPWVTVPVPHYPRLIGTPTGGSVRVIIRMFRELWNLRTAR